MLAVVLVFAAVWVLPGSSRQPLRRIQPMRPPEVGRSDRGPWIENRSARTTTCVVAAVAVCWTLGGARAGAAGVALGLALSWWLGRLESPSAARAREQVERDLPLAADLMAACVEAGRPVDASLRVVAQAVGGELGRRFLAVTSRLELGADAATEWDRVAADPLLTPLGRAMRRTAASGAAPVDALLRLSDDQRRKQRSRSQARARSCGVKAAGPLALCFLPAFMLIGVVPTIAGAVTHLLS